MGIVNDTETSSKSTKLKTKFEAEALQRLDANDITELDLWHAYFRDEGATSISNALIKNTSLTHLDLGGNRISDFGAISISNSLMKNTSLTHLSLLNNSIGDSGATAISNALINNTSLKMLNLRSNSIKETGATSISELLIRNTSLTHLDFGVNRICDLGVTSISNSLIKNTSLKHLDLNIYTGEGGVKLLGIQPTIIVNTNLMCLYLCSNPIDNEAALKLIEHELNTNKDSSKLQQKKEKLKSSEIGSSLY